MASNGGITGGVDFAFVAEGAASKAPYEAPKWSYNSKETIDAVYGPLQLQEQEIRLVILGRAPSVDTPPVCRLKVVKLTTRPVFGALSWAWGDPSRTQPMTLQGRAWQAPENLVAALKCLRAATEPTTLWVDALCINQSAEHAALRERGQQVRLMKYIFSLASHVMIWMGIPEGDLAEFLITYAFQNQSIEDAARQEPVRTISMVKKLLKLPWWQRLWGFQECALNSMVSMNFGSEAIEFRHFLNGLESIRAFYLTDPQTMHVARTFVNSLPETYLSILLDKNHTWGWEEIAGQHRQQINDRVPVLNHDDAAGSPVALPRSVQRFIDILSSCRHQLTSDPRDKVYALLGLANNDVIVAELEPNYNESVVQTLVRTTAKLISLQRSLYILCQATRQTPSDIEMLPSWVPDWSVPAESRLLWLAETRMRSRVDASFKACSDTYAEVRLLTDNVLKMKGIWVDIIASTSVKMDEWQKFSDRLTSSRDTWDGRGFLKAEYEKATFGRRLLFATHDGLLGVGSLNIESGDCVFVLAGGNFPFVLRRCGPDRYKLVGECCIQGLMYGKATESGYKSMRQRYPDLVGKGRLRLNHKSNWEDIYLE